MEQMQKNSAKSVILPHKHRINNVPGRKISFFPAHCGSFSMSSLQTHERRHWWASNVIQTHLGMCEERIKIKSHSAGKKNMHFFFLQVTMHLSCLWVSEWVDINRPLSGSWYIASWVWSNYKAENIHKECFIINGTKSSDECQFNYCHYCQSLRVSHIVFC